MRTSVRPGAWCAPALLALAVTADAASAPAAKKEEPRRQPAPTAMRPGESGLIVVRDAVTGELRAPEAEEAAALLRQAVPANNHSDEGLVDVAHPRGGYSRDLQGRFQEYFLVTRGADGTLEHTCVSDPVRAERLVRQPSPSSPQGEDR